MFLLNPRHEWRGLLVVFVKKREYRVENYYYTPDFYSCFSPSGFLPEEILFINKEDALNYALKNKKTTQYFILNLFKNNIDKASFVLKEC